MQSESVIFYKSAFILIAILTMYAWIAIAGINAFSANKETIIKLKNARAALPYLICTGVLYFTSTAIEPSVITKFVLLIISIAVAANFNVIQKLFADSCRVEKSTLVMLLLSLYASFAAFGYRFFLYGNTRPRFSLIGLTYYVLGVIWFFPVLKAVFCLISFICMKQRRIIPRSKQNYRAFLVLFSVLIICQGIVLLAFWPGVFPSDCTDQLSQAVGIRQLNDWHPVIHTLFFRAVISAFGSAGMITAIQMLLFVTVITLILMEGYYAGIDLLWLCIGGALFIMMPNQVFSSILTEKDFLYSVALLYATWSVFRITVSIKKQSPLFYIFFTADMFLIATLRHNGIVPFGFTVLLCIILSVKKKPQRIQLITSAIAAILLFSLYKGPLFDYLNVIPNAMKPYDIMLCAAGSCVNKDLPLSEKSNDIMSKVMPQDEWKKYYSRFSGHDAYIWGGGSGMDMSHISAADAFYVYFDALIHYPDVVIKDRLDGTNLLWDVTQPRDGYNYKAIDGVYGAAYEFKDIFDYEILSREGTADSVSYYNRSRFAEIYRTTINIEANNITDMLLWRSGIYIILFLIIWVVWHVNGLHYLFFSSVPMIGNIVSLILVMYHQSFRYIYAVQIQMIVLLFFTMINSKTESNAETLYVERNAS